MTDTSSFIPRPTITGRVGTRDGRNVLVERHPFHIVVRDAADTSPTAPFHLNNDQAEALGEALVKAARR